MERALEQRLFAPGPKRILALDGGGVRGALTLSYLERLETILRDRTGRGDAFRLSDYFDLIGGTSTGSIIASGLALGMRVSDLQELYRGLATSVFEKPPYRFGVLVPKFARQPLVDALLEHFQDRPLGSDDLKTGLMIMTKRIDTGSPWPLHNNPKGRYYEERPRSAAIANRHFLLWQIVRASTAAPHYFEPERLQVATDAEGRYVDGAFIDGGVSPSNNPSLQLLMLATLEGYKLQWPLGPDKLLLISVGTGDGEEALAPDAVMRMTAIQQAIRSLASLMTDCDALVRTMMQWLGETPTGTIIDREIGDLRNDTIGGQKWLTYVRYNATLEGPWLRTQLKLEIEDVEAAGLRAMDVPGNVAQLAHVGATAAGVQVRPEHLPPQFDI
jgi:patatin-like phospholipase